MVAVRLQSIEIPVSDIVRAGRFYADVLELPPIVRMGDQVATFFLGDVHGGMLSLVRSANPVGDSGPVVTFQAEGGLEPSRARLEALGVQFIGGVQHSPLGLTAYFLDSEGNRLAIFDGSISLRFREQARAPLAELEERLRAVESGVWGVLESVSEGQAGYVPAIGEWPILGHVGHIIDSLDSCGLLANDLAAGRQPPRDRLWQKEYPHVSLVESREALGRSFTAAHRWLGALPEAAGTDANLAHGVFGSLNYREWVAFMLFHVGMHTGQIKEIQATPGYPRV